MTRPIERYVRASIDIPGGSVEVGLQYERDRWPQPAWYQQGLRALIERAVSDLFLLRPGWHLDANLADEITAQIERALKRWLLADVPGPEWPGRGWFVEVWNGREALTQVYAPCGMPLDR